jgi:serralysin
MAIIFGTNAGETIGVAQGVTNFPDYIVAGDGDDTIFGHGGDDWIVGGKGADTMYGGSGIDTADYTDSNAGVVVSLWQNTGIGGSAEGDTFSSIEDLVGSNFRDILVGDGGVNWLRGMGGNDELKGMGGDDVLEGASGNDRLIGGMGADTLDGGTDIDEVYYGQATSGVNVNLLTGVGAWNEAAGDTYVSIENVSGSHHEDWIFGNSQGNVLNGLNGDDFIDAGDGADTVYGGGNNDRLAGGNGDDTLNGGSGDDRLRGGNGQDNMFGGSGADKFWWKSVDETSTSTLAADWVWDFHAAEGDRIDLTDIDANVYAAGDQDFTFIGNAAFSGAPGEVRYYHDGGDTYIEMQTGTAVDVEGIIRLNGIHTPEASWFVL